MAHAGRDPREESEPSTVVVLDPAMQRLHEMLERAAASDISLLLLGETGVGKEVLAETVHRLSPRAGKPMVRLNCAAFTETLLESELFGHERGAFTGAVAAKTGLLESADGGTVFLDEVGELPLTTQVKLLRFFEDRRVMRIGNIKSRQIDVRLVSATNLDLEMEVANGRFRSDLYFRLNGFSVTIPPLRERVAEIEPLARVFLVSGARSAGRALVPQLSPEALALLRAYSWPGNVRELRNIINRAVVLCTGRTITPDHLPLEKLTAKQPVISPAREPEPGARRDALLQELEALERQLVVDALAQSAGNQRRAAKLLGIARNTLLKRLDRLGLPRPRKGSD